MLAETVRVYCRLRPSLPEHKEGSGPNRRNHATLITEVAGAGADVSSCIEAWDEKGGFTYRRVPGEPSKTFRFTGFLPPTATQDAVFNAAARRVVDGVAVGLNGTILAYGHTGAGKTFTMRGPEIASARQQHLEGITPRALRRLFAELAQKTANGWECTVRFSYLQIYCEMLQDLLTGPLPPQTQPTGAAGNAEAVSSAAAATTAAVAATAIAASASARSRSGLTIRERATGEVYVEGLREVAVTSVGQCLALLATGDAGRAVAATAYNAHSSRSHAAVIVRVEQRPPAGLASACCGGGGSAKDAKNCKDGKDCDDMSALAAAATAASADGGVLLSTLILADLAGCERVSSSTAGPGGFGDFYGGGGGYGYAPQRFEELRAINLSLSALGNCVSALAAGSVHVPHRDSKLTRLLRQSLGGNARTALVVAMAPGADARGEALSALNFGQRAASVSVAAAPNVVPDFEALGSRLQRQLDAAGDAAAAAAAERARLEDELAAAAAAAAVHERHARELQARLDAVTAITADAASAAVAAAATGKADNVAASGRSDDGSAQADKASSAAVAKAAAAAAAAAANARWQETLAKQQEAAARDAAAAAVAWGQRVEAYKTAAGSAQAEWANSEYELTKEREAHLAALQELRACHESLRTAERRADARVAELLQEVEDLHATTAAAREEAASRTAAAERLAAEVDAARRIAAEREAEAFDLRAGAAQAGGAVGNSGGDGGSGRAGVAGGHDWVSRWKVEEMEAMFDDAVRRLAARVQHLEASASAATVAVSARAAGFQAGAVAATSLADALPPAPQQTLSDALGTKSQLLLDSLVMPEAVASSAAAAAAAATAAAAAGPTAGKGSRGNGRTGSIGSKSAAGSRLEPGRVRPRAHAAAVTAATAASLSNQPQRGLYW